MIKLAKNFAVAALAAITVLAPLAEAQARDWRRHGPVHVDNTQIFRGHGAIRRHHRDYRHRDYRRHHRPRHVYRHHDDAGIALGIIGGLAAGAIIGGAIANQPVYRTQPQRVIRYSGGLEPWTRDWYNYCANRYRSFNASTGTFRGYDGQDHFCVAN